MCVRYFHVNMPNWYLEHAHLFLNVALHARILITNSYPTSQASQIKLHVCTARMVHCFQKALAMARSLAMIPFFA